MSRREPQGHPRQSRERIKVGPTCSALDGEESPELDEVVGLAENVAQNPRPVEVSLDNSDVVGRDAVPALSIPSEQDAQKVSGSCVPAVHASCAASIRVSAERGLRRERRGLTERSLGLRPQPQGSRWAIQGGPKPRRAGNGEQTSRGGLPLCSGAR